MSNIIAGESDWFNIYHNVGRVLDNAECGALYGSSGSEIRFYDAFTITVHDLLRLEGTDEEPVRVTFPDFLREDNYATIAVDWGDRRPYVILSHVNFEEGVRLNIDADSVFIDHCCFTEQVHIRANYVEVKNCHFTQPVEYDGWSRCLFERNLFESTVTIDGNPRECRMINNTIVNPEGDGVILDLFRSVNMRNNIVAFCRRGIVLDHWNEPVLEYNDVYGNEEGNYIDCELGIGSISADPLFSPRRPRRSRSDDFYLNVNSPCIDAGDPASPLDPDGSRADMGAVCFMHDVSVADNDVMPDGFSLSAAPNPFNNRVTITLNSNVSCPTEWILYDVHGRIINNGTWILKMGRNIFKLNCDLLHANGLYIFSISLENHSKSIKLIYLQ